MQQKRLRSKLNWTPKWEGPIRAWSCNFISRNKWRCDPINDFEDLLQDAYLIYLKIVEAYPSVTEPQIFMGLFKMAMTNNMHDNARYVKRKRVVHEETSVDAPELATGRIGEVTNNGYVSALLAEAPEELQMALDIIENNPEALRGKPKVKRKRQNLNMRLRRILGFDTARLNELRNYDFTGTLKSLLQEQA